MNITVQRCFCDQVMNTIMLTSCAQENSLSIHAVQKTDTNQKGESEKSDANQKAKVSRRDMPTSDAPTTMMRTFSVTCTSAQTLTILNVTAAHRRDIY